MWPVVIRELQAEARHPFTYWMRMLGAGALLLAALFVGLESGLSINEGGALFARLHLLLFCSIWMLVPLVTADCISRERREGTLGLLFLTPLTARAIVVAKTLAHGLRALTLCMAVLPVLTLPFLMGGVSWQEAAFSATTNFSSFCWAVAAGVLASSWTKAWLRSLACAIALACVMGACFACANTTFSMLTYMTYSGGFGWRTVYYWPQFFYAAFFWATDMDQIWKQILQGLPQAQAALVGSALGGGLLSFGGLVLVLQIASVSVRRHWREEPPSAQRVWLERTFCTPILGRAFFRRWMQRKLNHNPIGWLEQRTWRARLVTWSWLAIMISLLSVGVGEVSPGWSGRGFARMEGFLAWLLAGSVAMTAAGSFRRERETGVLELLLVSPLRVSNIISGRLRGIWGQFVPAIGLLLISWLYL